MTGRSAPTAIISGSTMLLTRTTGREEMIMMIAILTIIHMVTSIETNINTATTTGQDIGRVIPITMVTRTILHVTVVGVEECQMVIIHNNIATELAGLLACQATRRKHLVAVTMICTLILVGHRLITHILNTNLETHIETVTMATSAMVTDVECNNRIIL